MPQIKIFKVSFNIIETSAFQGAMWVFEDITQQQLHEDQLELLNKALELKSRQAEETNKRYLYSSRATSEAIWDWDLVNGTIFWGEGFKNTFGHNPKNAALNISAWTRNFHPNDSQRVQESIQESLKGSETYWSCEYRYMKFDGIYAYVLDKGFIIRDDQGKPIRFVGAMQDITERVRSEQEAKNFADEIYKHNKELQQFGYIVSHNLRAPLANILGLASLIDADKSDPESVGLYTERLKTSAGNLDTVLKDLSKILSVNDGTAILPREMVELDEIIANVKTDLSELISYNQAVIIGPVEPYRLFTHKAYLHSALFNLISNAIKYRSDKDPIVIVSALDSEMSKVISVSDNGIGIDLGRHGEELCKPYKRFNTAVKGKGLGLFLVKSHVESLNGNLFIESEPGQGSTFTIALPIS